MNYRNSALVLVAVAALVLPAVARNQATTMRMAVAEGDAYLVTTTSKSKISITGAMEQELNMGSTATYTMTFGAEKDSWRAATLDNMTVKSEGEAIPGVDPDAMSAAAAKVSMTMLVSPRGEVKDVKSASDDPEAVAAAGSISSGLKSLGLNGFVFPETEVKVGDTWEVQVDLAPIIEASSGGQVTATNGKLPIKYTFVATETVEGTQVHRITFSYAGTMDIENAMVGPGKAKTESKGTIWIDAKTGFMFRSDSVNKIIMELGPVSVDVSVDQKMTAKKK
ncbi:MAG: hypothetical protein MUC92_04180 [Fimbriimonadaceae bacterium]|jgi:hypothetical protein|nr:hypothetical protein [Fimbriimonadaceae bacterium]